MYRLFCIPLYLMRGICLPALLAGVVVASITYAASKQT